MKYSPDTAKDSLLQLLLYDKDKISVFAKQYLSKFPNGECYHVNQDYLSVKDNDTPKCLLQTLLCVVVKCMISTRHI